VGEALSTRAGVCGGTPSLPRKREGAHLRCRSNEVKPGRILNLVEPIERVQRSHGKFGIGGVDQHRKLDFGSGDGADVDIAGGKRGKGLGGNTGMATSVALSSRT
jgi:hypothetical protein